MTLYDPAIRMGLKKAIRAMSITFFISSFIKIHMSQELGIPRSSRSLTFFTSQERSSNIRSLILPEK